jgi:hypothetical protein
MKVIATTYRSGEQLSRYEITPVVSNDYAEQYRDKYVVAQVHDNPGTRLTYSDVYDEYKLETVQGNVEYVSVEG